MPPSGPQICFLLALWGKNYIRLFCDISLRSLLAEGNIPALAKEYRCTFTLLTKTEDIKFFESQPIFQLLRQYCEIRYVEIGDIIFAHNHSATLTVALERGMRSRGSEMLDTYFILLVGDYLFAERSLSGLLPYMRRGVSAITAGNYQVVEEEVMEEVKRFIDPATGVISVPNRELVAWSLRHLHPMTVANTVNAGETCTSHTNRLFWRADNDTLIGRFYLRHMLCIKPEIVDYVIGSSCDYSFIHEMCPSGNVAHIADSDEYFIVELQPLLHEGVFIGIGRHTPEFLAQGLAEWATAGQRANAYTATVFHAGDISSAAVRVVEESRHYVERVEKLMPTPPLPVRGHFYWLSCIQWITAKIADEPEEYVEKVEGLRKNIWDSPVFSAPLKAAGADLDSFPPMRDEDVLENLRWLLQCYRAYLLVFGRPPATHFWHPHYLDYRLLFEALSRVPDGPVLLILPPKRRQWLEWAARPGFVLRSPLIAYRDTESLRAELNGFSSCVIHLTDEYDPMIGAIFDRLLEAMPAGSNIFIFIKTPMFGHRWYSLRHRALRYAHFDQKPGARLLKQSSYSGRVRRFMDAWFSKSASRLANSHGQALAIVWYGAQVGLLHLAYVVHNALYLLGRPFVRGIPDSVCSALLTFQVETTQKDA